MFLHILGAIMAFILTHPLCCNSPSGLLQAKLKLQDGASVAIWCILQAHCQTLIGIQIQRYEAYRLVILYFWPQLPIYTLLLSFFFSDAFCRISACDLVCSLLQSIILYIILHYKGKVSYQIPSIYPLHIFIYYLSKHRNNHKCMNTTVTWIHMD